MSTIPLNYHEQRKQLKKKYFNLPDIPQNLKDVDFNILQKHDFDWMSVYQWLHRNGYSDLKNHVSSIKNRKDEDVLMWRKITRVKSNNDRNIPVTVKGLFYPHICNFNISCNDRLLDLIHMVKKYTGFNNTQIRVLNHSPVFVLWDPKNPNEDMLQQPLEKLIGTFEELNLFISLVY
jgi:hypothetical protein